MYDAVAMQPIAQGILFASITNPPIPTFFGRGISAVTRIVTVQAPVTTQYWLTLDAGLPGNAGEVAPGTVPIATLVGPPPTFTPTPEQAVAIRCQFAIRGAAKNPNAIGGTNITSTAVTYVSAVTPVIAPAPPVPTTDGGDNQVVLVFQNAAGGSIDPNPGLTAPIGNANGVEIVIWKVASASTAVGGG